MNPTIKKFVENYEAACTLIRCGFELETQEMNGMKFEDFTTDNIANWNPYLIRFSRDRTVSGPEIKTIGGKTVEQFKTACNFLMNNPDINFTVDGHCSFHIHVSLPNVQHSYGKSFQLWIYNYLLIHWNQLPICIMERLVELEWMERYYKMDISKEKYKFVACRTYGNEEEGNQYTTWEFRFLGNISKYDDAIKCLEIVIQAMRYAYECKIKTENNIEFATMSINTCQDMLNGYINQYKTNKRDL